MIFRVLALLAIGYALVCALIYVAQERLIFFPERDPPGTRYTFGIPAEEVWIPVDGAQLHALWFRVAAPQGIILYLHGNAGSLRSWGAVAADLTPHGYDVLIADYRGYGQSTGRISNEAQFYADAAALYDWVLERYPAERVVIYGRSLGSAPAARLAAERRPRLLILESPFYSLEALARRQFPWAPPLLLKYPLRTHSWMADVTCPVVILHGAADSVVPFADGERLAAMVAAPLQFHPIAGGDHNNLAAFPAYHDAIARALGAFA
jgi:alpha-beta hydrolase superfamily lysophospholipase